ncbi:protein of unknown function [Shewanella benthica]|uniref:Uncharacterized protein n=1 Tax=Shewanella benthica TaxID=43661 RepID=A0A330M8U5_9GAMM|nr:protein of unknown function [Shewanella benthica]
MWRLEPSAVKVARWVLRRAALGNRCRLSDKSDLLTHKTKIEEIINRV